MFAFKDSAYQGHIFFGKSPPYFSKVCLYEENPFSPALFLLVNSKIILTLVFQRRGIPEKVPVYCGFTCILPTRRIQE